jgi:serine/threonine protein kinase
MSGGNAKPDRYVPVRELGEGGAGRVQLVEDRLRPGATLALKELAEESRGQEEGLRREFATLALLRHPNLVEVHDLDVAPDTGLPRFTLEYIDGEDFVAAVRREGPAALPELTAEVLRALSFLHDFGLIHRDLKPANVLVRRRPRLGCRAVVLDFGLALRGGSERPQGDPAADGAAGTLPYLAPELFEGGRANRRSDLYAVGALVYEAAHGSPAFRIEGKDLARFVDAVREGRRARPPLPEGFPPLLSAWLEELLSPDPSSRPGDAIEALARLNAACGTSYPTETPATRAARLGSGSLPGRDDELNALWGHLDETEGPRLVWLCGGAGSGKSRVLRYLSGEAVARGWEVITPPPGLEVPVTEGSSGVEQDVAATLAELRDRAAARQTLLLVDEVETAPDRSVRLLERIAREGKGPPLRATASRRAKAPGRPRHRSDAEASRSRAS